MAVDMMRSCYQTEFRFFTDSPLTTTVRYYFTDKPSLPIRHAFGSRNWQSEGEEFGPLGEVEGATRKWVSGAKVGSSQGDHYCGTQDQWLHGQPLPPDPPVSLLEDGTPSCCVHVPLQNMFLGAGGQAQGYDRANTVGRGGQRQGGRGAFNPSLGAGGQQQGGYGLAVGVSHGGQQQGGQALWTSVATGGQSQGGSGSGSPTGAGGQEQGGYGSSPTIGSGGELQGGSLAYPPPASGGEYAWASAAGTGGQSQGGSGSVFVWPAGQSHGGQSQGGSGYFAWSSPGALGGQSQGGSGSVFVWLSPIALSGQRQGGEGNYTVPVLSNYTGATLSGFIPVFDVIVTSGLNGSFVLKNTHATNNLQYKYTFTDMFGTATTPMAFFLAPGQKFSVQYESGANSYPIKEAKLEVADQISGNHATYSVYESHIQ